MYSKHFSNSELSCRCGCGLNNCSAALVDALERIRLILGCPLRVTSAARCATRNAAVGGVKNSFHLLGEAADFVPLGRSALSCFRDIVRALESGELERVGAVIFYGRFIHVDTRPRRGGRAKYLVLSGGRLRRFIVPPEQNDAPGA